MGQERRSVSPRNVINSTPHQPLQTPILTQAAMQHRARFWHHGAIHRPRHRYAARKGHLPQAHPDPPYPRTHSHTLPCHKPWQASPPTAASGLTHPTLTISSPPAPFTPQTPLPAPAAMQQRSRCLAQQHSASPSPLPCSRPRTSSCHLSALLVPHPHTPRPSLLPLTRRSPPNPPCKTWQTPPPAPAVMQRRALCLAQQRSTSP